MSKKIKLPEVKQLITLGKEKGFLTFDEINDALPEDAATSDFLDEIITLLSQLKIDVIDNKSKKGNIFPTNVVIDDEDDEDSNNRNYYYSRMCIFKTQNHFLPIGRNHGYGTHSSTH